MLLREINFEAKALCESTTEGGPKNWFLQGVFMQSDVNNRNRRRYPHNIMEAEVANYVRDFVNTRRSVGELQHPNTPEINLDRVSHIIESINVDGKNFIGRAKILPTPAGNIAKGLLEGGVQLGVSSRGMGAVVEEGGIGIVQPNFKLATVDIVYSPSAPDAFVTGLMEGTAWVWNSLEEDQEFLDSLKKDVRSATKSNLDAVRLLTLEKALAKASGNQIK